LEAVSESVCGEKTKPNSVKAESMAERQHTTVCAFDQRSPRVSAFDIHEWIYETLQLKTTEVCMIQIDKPRRHIYIKFQDPQRMNALLTETQGQKDFRYDNGEISKVRIEAVGLRMRRMTVANLPLEVAERTLKTALGAYGEIRDIQAETWLNAYRYPVANGIRIIEITLRQHILSHMEVAGHRTLISYQGQPTTCYGCNEIGHLYTACPHRRRARAEETQIPITSWVEVAAKGTTQILPIAAVENTEMTVPENTNTGTQKMPSRPTPRARRERNLPCKGEDGNTRAPGGRHYTKSKATSNE
jgi:hypothetical protein